MSTEPARQGARANESAEMPKKKEREEKEEQISTRAEIRAAGSCVVPSHKSNYSCKWDGTFRSIGDAKTKALLRVGSRFEREDGQGILVCGGRGREGAEGGHRACCHPLDTERRTAKRPIAKQSIKARVSLPISPRLAVSENNRAASVRPGRAILET